MIYYLTICSQNKPNREHKLPSHSDSNLRFKNPCSQSSIQLFKIKVYIERKISWLWILLKHMLLWEVLALVSLYVLSYFFLLKDLKMLKNLFLILILKFLFPALKNQVFIQRVLSLILSWSPPVLKFPNESIKKRISVDELEEPSNMLSEDKYDNCNVHYLGKSAKIIQNSDSDSSWSSEYLIKERRNYYNCYLYLLQSNISINLYSYWGMTSMKLMKFAHIYVVR